MVRTYVEFTFEGPKTATRGGVNGSRNKISLETFGHCLKITVKHKQVPKLKYQRQLATRVSRKNPRNDRKTTQKTEHKSKLKRANSR
jgi:hypothetical protein